MGQTTGGVRRLAFIDLVRGVAVVLMIMHHVLDSWVHDPERSGMLWRGLRHAGGVPAPSFMLLAGLAAALVNGRERAKGLPRRERVLLALRRGLYVLGIAFAYRVFAFVAGGLWWPGWQLMFRVDVLNCMGVALAVCAPLATLAGTRRGSTLVGLALFAVFCLPAPLLWGSNLGEAAGFLGNYVAGSGPLVLFPLFPWAAWVAAGLALGDWIARLAETASDEAVLARKLRVLLPAGVALFVLGWALDAAPFSVYPRYDFWRSSPEYVLMRMGVQLVLLSLAAQAAVRLPALTARSSPLMVFGRHSLFAYVFHLELAYGLVTQRLHKQLTLAQALGGVVLLNAATLGAIVLLERLERRRAPAAAASPAT